MLSLFWLACIVGAALLCVCAHMLSHLRRLTLTALILWLSAQGGGALLNVLCGSAANFAAQISHKWVAAAVSFGISGAWYLCFAAFAVFAVLLLVRASSKKKTN